MLIPLILLSFGVIFLSLAVVLALKTSSEEKIPKLALLAHELKTPLSGIQWTSELLMNGDVGSLTLEQEEWLGEIHESAVTMIKTMEMFMGQMDFDDGEMIVKPIPSDINEILNKVISYYEGHLNEKNIKVEKEMGAALKEVKVDPALLRMLLNNAISNAIKYSPSNESIKINVEKKFSELHFEISNIGNLSVRDLKIAFQKGFRGSNKGNTHGTGLGLFLIRSIAEAYGGEAHIETKKQNVTLKFWIPIVHEEPNV